MQLARLVAVDLIRAVRDRDVEAVFAGPSTGFPMPAALVDVMYGVVPVSGLDFGALVMHPEIAWQLDRPVPQVPYVWGQRSIARAVTGMVGTYRRHLGLDATDHRLWKPAANRKWARMAHNNYAHLCAEARSLIECSAWSLRFVLHLAFRIFRHFDERTEYRARPSRWVNQLQAIAELDVQRVSDRVYEYHDDSGVPIEWLWEGERRFESIIREQGQVGLVLAWGLPVWYDDSLERTIVWAPSADPVVPPAPRPTG